MSWIDEPSYLAQTSLEWKLTNRLAFGLTTASPLQRAICRVADGKPLKELATHPGVIKAFGQVPTLARRPREVAILSGIRTGKSLFAAALAVHWAIGCDVSKLGPGEIPRVSIVSIKKDLADVVFNHVVGRLRESVFLSQLLVSEPTAEIVQIRHPTGIPVEIAVVAGSRAGSSLVARWSAGCVFDEFPRMVGESEGVVNWDHERRSVALRLLAGAQLVHIGSPWAPFGPAYNLVQARWGQPTEEMVIAKAPGWEMNPEYWTPERISDAEKADVNAYTTDVCAEFASQEDALIPGALVESSTRESPFILPYEEGHEYRAAMDPATRSNGWTLVVATRDGNLKRIVFAKEWRGSEREPLSPRVVLREMGEILRSYRVRTVESDQYYIDALQDIAREVGIGVVQSRLSQQEKVARWMAIKARMAEGEIELSPDPMLKSDLKRLTRNVTQSGIAIGLPKTSDGRHCDYAPSILLVLSSYLQDAREPAPKEDPEVVRMRDAAIRRFGRKAKW